jgi:hypothetical protein
VGENAALSLSTREPASSAWGFDDFGGSLANKKNQLGASFFGKARLCEGKSKIRADLT